MTADAKPTQYRAWLGAGLLASGVIANPYILGWIFAPDGSIDGDARYWQIVIGDVFCIMAGAVLASPTIRAPFRPYVRTPVFAAVLVAVATATLVGPAWGILAYRRAHLHTHSMGTTQPPTEGERQWAADFVERARESAMRHGWLDRAKAEADGFVPVWNDTEHLANREFLFDDRVLDPERPEFVMYIASPSGQKVLSGFMFFTRTLDEHGPTPGGSLAQWHYHPWLGRGICTERGVLPLGRPNADGTCPAGIRVDRSVEMLHVWFIDHPLGPFADAMIFPEQKEMSDSKLIHPMVVHFGIALVILSAFLDVVARIARQQVLHTVAAVNLCIAVLATITAVATGMLAEVQLVIPHDVHQVLDTHKLFGFSALGGVLVLGLWRAMTRGAFPVRAGGVYLGIALLTAALAALAGHRGAELVFVHGAAVQAIDRLALERYERSIRGATTAVTPAVAAGTHDGH